ncbi:RAI1 like PD-XK nuclease-domain-containing protein [Syncephalastrum racemosum]|uniref:Decapping nuclease n=1 Tax=Syncephalastrum racemosum TaxID=13706 RepID=A0A1X2H3L1_SYNRA|nr:RAI1 like PD-XK nuclease-domain-containing protein [Syncephalastrum racemosum]
MSRRVRDPHDEGDHSAKRRQVMSNNGTVDNDHYPSNRSSSSSSYPYPAGGSRTRSLRVGRWQEYQGHCPAYKQPIELHSYSIDEKRHVWFDNRELKEYHEPRIDSRTPNLSSGYDKFVQRDESIPEHLDTLLDALTDCRNTKSVDTKADIVTWRGIMTKLLCTPYSRDPWELRATRYNDTIYIEEQPTEEKRSQEAQKSERQSLMGYWGYSFESLCTQTDPKELDANTNVQYCVVVKTKLGNNAIVMGAEVDCIQGKKPTDRDPLRQYVELKTSRRIETDRHLFSFEKYKLIKFWAQSFLVGVPRVICGFRDDDGNLDHVESLKTMEIPRRVRGKPNMWDASVCLNFANECLEWIKSVVTLNDPCTTYAIVYKAPFREITVECCGEQNTFLTQRYIEGSTQHEIGGERAQRPRPK